MSVPYIGAKISLTSRSAIRYEGILASVNPKEATISLERVRVMGTEGRRPGNEIQPSNDVYDMVEFRSNDIDDLQIFESPSPPKPSFVDPAIISSSSSNNNPTISGSPQMEPVNTGIGSGAWPAAPRLQFGTATSLGTVGQQRANLTTPSITQFGTLHRQQQHQQQQQQQQQASTWGTFGSESVKSNATPVFGSISKMSAPFTNSTESIIKSSSSVNRVETDTSNSITRTKTITDESEKVMAYNTATGKIELVERQTRSFASVVSDGAGRFKVTGQSAPRVIPKNDYDFQQANARLQKETVPEPSKEAFYDKNVSFFDKISCESTIGKDHDKNERQWNIETFGVAAPYRGSGYRGGYRHGGHRGGRGNGRGGSRGGYQQSRVSN